MKTIWKTLSLLLTAVMLFALAPSLATDVQAAQAAHTPGQYQANAPVSGILNLRRDPSTNSPILAHIPHRTILNVTEVRGSWGRTTFQNRTGWISLDHAIRVNPPQPTGIRFPLRGNMSWSSSVTTHGFFCDFTAPMNTRVYAPGNGTISFRQYYRWHNGQRHLTSFGNSIVFNSSCGRYNVRLGHLNGFANVNSTIPSYRTRQVSGSTGVLNLGSRTVRQGDLIAWSGTTGNSSGPHLHLELRVNGRPASPRDNFRIWH